MREILFRGKRKDNGEWVYGSLGVVRSDLMAIYQCKELENDSIILVDVDTVGQYTGLNDKNGKMIFEGDICKDSIGVRFMVKWDADNALFIGRTIGGYGKDGYYFAPQRIVYVGREPKVTVIGNAYDNPELLKGEE